MKYYIEKTINQDFDSAVQLVKDTMPKYGFGAVSEFDIDKKFKEKLNVDFRKYKVIGACNPKYAYEALQTEPMIGTMLPCNIIIQETESNKISIAAIDPVASMQAVENAHLKTAANQIKQMLSELIAEL